MLHQYPNQETGCSSPPRATLGLWAMTKMMLHGDISTRQSWPLSYVFIPSQHLAATEVESSAETHAQLQLHCPEHHEQRYQGIITINSDLLQPEDVLIVLHQHSLYPMYSRSTSSPAPYPLAHYPLPLLLSGPVDERRPLSPFFAG